MLAEILHMSKSFVDTRLNLNVGDILDVIPMYSTFEEGKVYRWRYARQVDAKVLVAFFADEDLKFTDSYAAVDPSTVRTTTVPYPPEGFKLITGASRKYDFSSSSLKSPIPQWQDSDGMVVSHCPIRGHAPVCTNAMCREEAKNGYKACYKELGIRRDPPKEEVKTRWKQLEFDDNSPLKKGAKE